jgi:hypothetical protein
MQVGALSPDGRCKAFGAEADGYGRGEGFIVTFMEPASTGGLAVDACMPERTQDCCWVYFAGTKQNTWRC